MKSEQLRVGVDYTQYVRVMAKPFRNFALCTLHFTLKNKIPLR